MSELFTRNTVEIDAPAGALWQVLTDSSFIEQYMFGCRVETDWKPGSILLWIGAGDGTLYVKGEIVANQEPWLLAYTIFDPNSAFADVPSNYLTVTYRLQARSDKQTTLEITQGDYALVANGRERYEHSKGVGASILEKIKQLAESLAMNRGGAQGRIANAPASS